jgi:hypothetical protein
MDSISLVHCDRTISLPTKLTQYESYVNFRHAHKAQST